MSKINFVPVGDRIIVKPLQEKESRTKSGIIVTQRDAVNRELPQCGEVVAVGTGGTFPDCPNPSKVFAEGDFVYFNKYAGEEFSLEEDIAKPDEEKEKFIVLRLDAVFGKLKDVK